MQCISYEIVELPPLYLLWLYVLVQVSYEVVELPPPSLRPLRAGAATSTSIDVKWSGILGQCIMSNASSARTATEREEAVAAFPFKAVRGEMEGYALESRKNSALHGFTPSSSNWWANPHMHNNWMYREDNDEFIEQWPHVKCARVKALRRIAPPSWLPEGASRRQLGKGPGDGGGRVSPPPSPPPPSPSPPPAVGHGGANSGNGANSGKSKGGGGGPSPSPPPPSPSPSPPRPSLPPPVVLTMTASGSVSDYKDTSGIQPTCMLSAPSWQCLSRPDLPGASGHATPSGLAARAPWWAVVRPSVSAKRSPILRRSTLRSAVADLVGVDPSLVSIASILLGLNLTLTLTLVQR